MGDEDGAMIEPVPDGAAVPLGDAVPLLNWKFAHVRRVVLEVCMTKDRLPRKDPRPSFVETYRSE